MKRRPGFRIAGLLLLALAAACEGDGVTEPVPGAVGSYALVAVEGEALPYPFTATELIGGEIVEGTLTLDADRRFGWSYTVEWRFGTVPDTPQVIAYAGTWQETRDGLLFTTDEGAVSTGRTVDARLEMQAEVENVPNGLTYTFTRDDAR
jgi:hypothetical protein